jgi:hypothetical protein
MDPIADFQSVVSIEQRTTIAAYFLAIAQEFKILRGHPLRVWAIGKARAGMWIHSEIPEQIHLGILITSAVEVYPEGTKRICEVLLGKRKAAPMDLSGKWAPYLEAADA